MVFLPAISLAFVAFIFMPPVACGQPGSGWTGELSGVGRLPDGTFVLADDETRSVVFVWDGNPAHPPRRRAIGLALDDLEGVAADSSGFLYLLTSHSPTRRGRVRRERERLARLAPETPSGGVSSGSTGSSGWAVSPGSAASRGSATPGIDVVEDLTTVVLDLLGSRRSQLNLEGLAWYPPGDRLLVGARSPLREGKGQVLAVGPVGRLFDAARLRGSTVGLDLDVHALDLGGRGIRSLAYDPWRGVVWVLAGPIDGERVEYALFLWTPGGATIEAVEAPELAEVRQPEGVEPMGRPDPATGETRLLVAGEGALPLCLGARPREPGARR